jgi:hypothetical protein|tara:strand:- start:1538 stop:1897 length:360 start_codon:yes stop_codon:yes gene_type:complete
MDIALFFTFTFTLGSVAALDMLIGIQQFMNQSPNNEQRLFYRKRANPFRIVGLNTLKKTTNGKKSNDNNILVNSKGELANEGMWQPLVRPAIPVKISSNSWSGLHSRVIASREMNVGVA